MAKTFTITLEGKTQGDIESTAEEVLRLIREGYTSGSNRNEDGEFFINSEGEYE